MVGEIQAEGKDQIIGYAYAAPWKSRTAYRYWVESLVHSVMGGIALPNAASVALHERLGFRKIAHLQEVGYKSGQWLDVGYWQILLPG